MSNSSGAPLTLAEADNMKKALAYNQTRELIAQRQTNMDRMLGGGGMGYGMQQPQQIGRAHV